MITTPKNNRVSTHIFDCTDRLTESLSYLQAFEPRGNQGPEGYADFIGRIDAATADFNRAKGRLTTDDRTKIVTILAGCGQRAEQMRVKWNTEPVRKHQIV